MDTQLTKPTNVLFIGGTGRCGTNLMKEILSEHPQVAVLPFEYRFTIDPHGIIDCYKTLQECWSPYIAHNKIIELETLLLRMAAKSFKKEGEDENEFQDHAYANWELEKWFPNYRKHVGNMLEALKSHSYEGQWPGGSKSRFDNRMQFTPYHSNSKMIFREFLRSLMNDFLRDKEKKIFVEDNTWNMLFCRELKAILPEAKFIHMVRDPRDVIASLLHQRWAPSHLEEILIYYRSLMEKIIESSNSISDTNIMTLKLEDLVSSPDENLNNILDFCELEYFPKKIKKDLSHSNAGRWLKDFDQSEQDILLDRTKKYCQYFGYN